MLGFDDAVGAHHPLQTAAQIGQVGHRGLPYVFLTVDQDGVAPWAVNAGGDPPLDVGVNLAGERNGRTPLVKLRFEVVEPPTAIWFGHTAPLAGQEACSALWVFQS